ncbi:TPA: hypothetical protein I7730_14090 [Vibrio vulnificus]|uniref:Uncharacterized protein n=1 Tax=Vibrio vulnificus TaxID=672 RepID=A0A8H9N170_VIBVL|nr:hypothetical protein [Vibrio vulnificus]
MIRKSLGTQLSIESVGSIDSINGTLVYSHSTKIGISDNRKDILLAASTISDTAENLITLAEELSISKVPSIVAEFVSKTTALGQLGIKQATLFKEEISLESAPSTSSKENSDIGTQKQDNIDKKESSDDATLATQEVKDIESETQSNTNDYPTKDNTDTPQVEVVEDIDNTNVSNPSLEIGTDNDEGSEPLISASYVGNLLELMRTLNISSTAVLSYVRRDISSINDLYMKEAYSVSSRLRSAVNGNTKAIEIVDQRRKEFGAFSPTEVNGKSNESPNSGTNKPEETRNSEEMPILDKESENRRSLLINQIEKHSGNKEFVKALLSAMKKSGYHANTAEAAIKTIKKVDDADTIAKLQSAIGIAAMQII